MLVVCPSRVCSTSLPLFLGTCPCAVVMTGGVRPWRASWPCIGALLLFWSGRSRCSGRSSRRRVALPYRGLTPPDLHGGCAGHQEARRQLGSCCLPLAPAGTGAPGSLCVVPDQGFAMGLSPAGPSGVSLGICALRWLDLCGPGHSRVRFPVLAILRRQTQPAHQGCFMWTPTPPLLGRGRHAEVLCVCSCTCACFSQPALAGRPPERVQMRPTFPLAVLSLIFAQPVLGSGFPFLCGGILSFFVLFVFFFLVFLSFLHCACPSCPWFLRLSCPGCPWPLRSAFSSAPITVPPAPPFFFGFPPVPRAPVIAGILLFPASGVLGLRTVRFPPPPPSLLPPTLVCVFCLVLPGVAALGRPRVWCFAALFCPVPCCVSCCGGLPCVAVGCCASCGVLRGGILCVLLCGAVLLVAAVCRDAYLVVLPRCGVPFVSSCSPWSASPCAVLCPRLLCCATLLCVVPRGAVGL